MAEPIVGFSQNALRRAFDELAGELAEPHEVLPMFTEGRATQALAYVARAFRTPEPCRVASRTSLAPRQLRRAMEVLRADLSEHSPLRRIAKACKLSVSHFARAFKTSTGAPPHRWLLMVRVEMARELLVRSPTPLVEIVGLCGFADQCHFARVFACVMGISPDTWRREHHV